MDRGLPSMTALLGLIAVAGYQNRDKIAEMLGVGKSTVGAAAQASVPQVSQPPGGPGGLGGLLSGLGGASAGSLVSGGLSDLVDRFTKAGQGATAASWVNQGPNQPIAPQQLEQAIGPDVLASLTQHTGLSREDLLSRLTQALPHAVDQYTPDGRLPPADGTAPS